MKKINGYCGGGAIGFMIATLFNIAIGRDATAIAYAVLALVLVQLGTALEN